MTSSHGGSARRYAQAAFEVAIDRHDVKGWLADLDTLQATLTDENVALALENPRLDRGRRVGLALSLVPTGFNQERANFLKLLVLGTRTNLITEIRTEFQRLVDDAEGRVEFEVTVPTALSAAEQRTLTSELSDKVGRKVKVNVAIDPEIIGGLIIRNGDHVVDGSVRRRLAEMREELLAG
ncbi:MAG: F0F1 ATP synthase subunit delta [Candidatus Dormibacteraeota bacterium]|nr:F0F1 ATP synthase subunit delta [Candidatus Dormibacteraeota bacterium]